MCVICVKEKDVLFPSKQTLENCFYNNDDGAGFMYAHKGKVHIKKGLMTFDEFYEALSLVREKTGDNTAYVMHFRISTQGFNKECTHPFPLSSKMDNLKKLNGACTIGIAHNGILKLTSDGSHDYSDTMKFITDFLSLIIDSKKFYNDPKKLKLIERLSENNRLAILDNDSHITMTGKGWVHDKDGCYYSNNSYRYKTQVYSATSYNKNNWAHNNWFEDSYYGTSWDKNRAKYTASPNVRTAYKNNVKTTADKSRSNDVGSLKDEHNWEVYSNHDGSYTFSHYFCPYTEEDDDSKCNICTTKSKCPYIQVLIGTSCNKEQYEQTIYD